MVQVLMLTMEETLFAIKHLSTNVRRFRITVYFHHLEQNEAEQRVNHRSQISRLYLTVQGSQQGQSSTHTLTHTPRKHSWFGRETHLRTIPGDCVSQALKKRPETESELPDGQSQQHHREDRQERQREAIFLQVIFNNSRQICHLNDTST